MSAALPLLEIQPAMTTRFRMTESPEWRHWVTPRLARESGIHRWYLFPHSFTGQLVHALVREWALDTHDRILDPFAGSGTTLLAAKEMDVPATGYDLSPLAVLACTTKVAAFSRCALERAWHSLGARLDGEDRTARRRSYPELVRSALPHGRLEALDAVAGEIDELDCTSAERGFFRLALLSILPRFSKAIANGGWLRWSSEGADAAFVVRSFRERVESMLLDVRDEASHGNDRWGTDRWGTDRWGTDRWGTDRWGTDRWGTDRWRAGVADARNLPDPDATCSAVITSPPYPNRHDYTRVFGVELMFEFLDWERNRELRYQSFHSHPEARPRRPSVPEYAPPERLEGSIQHIDEPRIGRMLRGYFLDMYLCLREIGRVTRAGGKIALVVGNARYGGKPLLVDEFTAELGERAGLACREIRAVRWRGNSAQQMGRYGRVASRESVVLFEKPTPDVSSMMLPENQGQRSTTHIDEGGCEPVGPVASDSRERMSLEG